MLALRPFLAISLLTLTVLAGCAESDDDGADDTPVDTPTVYQPFVAIELPVEVSTAMVFTESVVTPAIAVAADLYEPTLEVSDTGTIYIAAHVIGAATTGTPAWYSNDDGLTWEQLPFAGPASSPLPTGSQPPPGDEGFIVAGDNGQAWMADIYLAGFSVSGWCGDGSELCYDNRQAYDRADAAAGDCDAADSLNDRPWAAFGNGRLLLVNNPGGGPMQLGVMDVPPATPVGLFGPMVGPAWNLCASPGGWIPGVPDAREDGFFAVPQLGGSGDDQYMQVITGNVDNIFEVGLSVPFKVTNTGSGTSNGGRIAFDKPGDLYLGVRNNTEEDKGRFILATSQDDGETWTNVTFETGTSVQSLYLDSNMNGPGVLVTWSQVGSTAGRADWYVAHAYVGPNGEPILENISLAVDEGTPYSAHVMGAGAGPDGRAYFVAFDGGPAQEYAGSTPLSVWIQMEGPTLPIVE